MGFYFLCTSETSTIFTFCCSSTFLLIAKIDWRYYMNASESQTRLLLPYMWHTTGNKVKSYADWRLTTTSGFFPPTYPHTRTMQKYRGDYRCGKTNSFVSMALWLWRVFILWYCPSLLLGYGPPKVDVQRFLSWALLSRWLQMWIIFFLVLSSSRVFLDGLSLSLAFGDPPEVLPDVGWMFSKKVPNPATSLLTDFCF